MATNSSTITRVLAHLRRLVPTTSRSRDVELINPIRTPSYLPTVWLVSPAGAVFQRVGGAA